MDFVYEQGVKVTDGPANDPCVRAEDDLEALLSRKGYRFQGDYYYYPPDDNIRPTKWIYLFQSGRWTARPDLGNVVRGSSLRQYLSSVVDYHS